MTKVLITGASGFIGRNLASYLAEAGMEVHGSDVTPPPLPSKARISFTPVDILDKPSLIKWIRSSAPDYVVHLGARTDLLGKSLGDYAANTIGVDNVIEACSSLPSLRRVIFASSRMVCPVDYIPHTYEDYCPPNFYGTSKMEGEKRVRAADVGYSWVMVRPTSIWGPGFGIPYRNFFDQIRKRRYFHPSGCRPRKSFGFVGNTVYQLKKLLAAEDGEVNRKTFYLGDYDPLDVLDWANHIHSCFGYEGVVRQVPVFLLRWIALLGDGVNKLSSADRAPLTSFRLSNLLARMVYPQLSELRAVTGDLPYSWREGTAQTVDWLRREK